MSIRFRASIRANNRPPYYTKWCSSVRKAMRDANKKYRDANENISVEFEIQRMTGDCIEVIGRSVRLRKRSMNTCL